VDAELIRLVLRHLLDNAVKYSPPSAAIRLSAEAGGEAATIRVWNGGPGLPEREKPRIFEKFYRGTAAGRQAAGTGMGLAIARQIMLAHGGDIQVESSEGQGVEFSLTLPIRKEALV
jgi:two-component system sensor histidine kinase KdpD